ncbi:MAG: imidazole glycerol phosphate synthase subunit HisF [Actinomycetota bacterium]
MTCPRLIPVVLMRHGRTVLSRDFARHHAIGDAVQVAERYMAWDLDELVYLDISSHWPGAGAGFDSLLDAVRRMGRWCFVPLTVGGGLRDLDQMAALQKAGADRFVLNSAALAEPAFITRAARRYGAQALVVAVDARRTGDGYEVFADAARRATGWRVEDWCAEAARRGAGEILINAVDRDGTGAGFDLDLVARVAAAVEVPVIACGGAGAPEHFAAPIRAGAAGAAAGNVFAFRELSYHLARQAMLAEGVGLREGVVHRDYAAAKRPHGTGSRLGADREEIWRDLDRIGRDDLLHQGGGTAP